MNPELDQICYQNIFKIIYVIIKYIYWFFPVSKKDKPLSIKDAYALTQKNIKTSIRR